MVSLVAQMVKNLPAVQDMWAWSLGQEDPLEKGMAITPVFLPGEFHGQRNLASHSLWGHKELDTTEWPTLSLPRGTASATRKSLEEILGEEIREQAHGYLGKGL